jgi:hypothetical protein
VVVLAAAVMETLEPETVLLEQLIQAAAVVVAVTHLAAEMETAGQVVLA